MVEEKRLRQSVMVVVCGDHGRAPGVCGSFMEAGAGMFGRTGDRGGNAHHMLCDRGEKGCIIPHDCVTDIGVLLKCRT